MGSVGRRTHLIFISIWNFNSVVTNDMQSLSWCLGNYVPGSRGDVSCLVTIKRVSFFFKIELCVLRVLFVGPLIKTVLDYLVMSPLGFKARVGSALFALGRGIHLACALRFTSGATPADLLLATMAAELISPIYL